MSHEIYISTPAVPKYDTKLFTSNPDFVTYENAEAAEADGLTFITKANKKDLDVKFGQATSLQRIAVGWTDIALAETGTMAIDVYGRPVQDEVEEARGVVGALRSILRRK